MTLKDRFTDFKNNRKIRSFLSFLFLSTLFWFITALSSSYTYLATYNLVYTNLPKNLKFQTKPQSEALIHIKATGFRILSHKLFQKDLILDVSNFKKKGKYAYFFLPNQALPLLQKQVNNESLLYFKKDTLTLSLGVLKSIKIPVLADVDLEFKPGFRVKGDLVVVPDSIVIKGSERTLDSIYYIKTKRQKILKLDQDFTKRIPLELPSEALSYSQTEIEIIANVSKFTEGELEVPVLFEGFEVEQNSTKIKLKFQVAFEDYSKLDPSSFKLVSEFPKDTISGKKAKIRLVKQPDFVSEITMFPKTVPYMKTNSD